MKANKHSGTRAALCLSDGLEAQIDWAIIFDDKDRPPEFFANHDSAMSRFDALAMSWNCHLFQRVESR